MLKKRKDVFLAEDEKKFDEKELLWLDKLLCEAGRVWREKMIKDGKYLDAVASEFSNFSDKQKITMNKILKKKYGKDYIAFPKV